MGYLDTSTKFSIDQAPTGSTGDIASTNVYDNGSANSSEMGLTQELWINVVCSLAATSAGAAVVTAVLQDSADGTTYADAMAGAPFALAALVAGAVLLRGTPPIGTRRYARVVYRVATAALTAGKFNAFISLDVQHNIARPSGFTVG